MRKTFTVLAAMVLGLGMAYLPAAGFAAEKIVTLAGAGPQGRWFKEASLVGKILTEHLKSEGTQVNGVIGKGVSVGNIKRIHAQKIDGGRGFLPDLADAYVNRGQFADGRDYKNVVAWITLNPLIFRLIADKSITSYSDLKGHTVAIGARGSGDDRRAKEILASYGVTAANAKFQYLGRSDAQNALTNRQIDALLISYSRNNRGHLGPVFAARPLRTDVRFVEPSDDVTRKFLKEHGTFYLDTLGEPVFGYPKLKGIAVRTGFMIRKDLPEDLVYKMTKIIFDNWNTVIQSAPWWNEKGAAGLDVAAQFVGVPYHPGAVKYYKEKGVWQKYHKG